MLKWPDIPATIAGGLFGIGWVDSSIRKNRLNAPQPGNEQCSTLPTFPFRGGCKLWDSPLPPPPAPVNHRGVVIFASVNRRSGEVRYRIPFVVRDVVFVDYAAVVGYIDAWYAAGCPDLDGEGRG